MCEIHICLNELKGKSLKAGFSHKGLWLLVESRVLREEYYLMVNLKFMNTNLKLTIG